MDHTDLRPDLATLIQGPRSNATKGTKAFGTKVMETGDDMTWTDPATGTLISVREIPSALDALAADLAVGVETAGKWNTVATTGPGSAADFPEGAFWTRVDTINGALVAGSRWTVKGGKWEPIGLDASSIVTGSINAGLIDAVALAARMVDGKLIRTGPTGQRVEMTSDGLVLWMIDPDGTEYRAVQIGPQGASLLTIGTSIITPDAVVAARGSFSDLAINGRPAAEFVDRRVAAQASRMVSLGGGGGEGVGIELDANVTTGIFDLVVPAVRKDRWYWAEIELTTYPRGNTPAELVVQLRHSRVDQGVMVNSPLVRSQRRIGAVSNVIWDQKHVSYWFHGSDLTEVSEGGNARILLVVFSNARIQINGSTTMAVYDTGSNIPISSTLNRGGAPQQGQTTATAQVASSQVRDYSQEWSATGSTTYWSGSNAVESQGGDVIQGSYDGTSGRRRHGLWTFPDMTSTLSGATITGVSIYVDNLHTFDSSGGTGHFYGHNGTNAAGASIMNASFSRGQDRWLDIPSQHWNSFKNGTIKGFMAYAASNVTSEYMRFAGGAESAKIRITWSK